ncbi:hypothetical protein [Aliiroseovarius sp.]|uniref:Flp family type IVb pilin n=1 Tax=Aliiroseovarius sp. TaxID=1872442 RepID=UPI002624394D|nr:hypothetical protein [Aliiroseovarius sp.]
MSWLAAISPDFDGRLNGMMRIFYNFRAKFVRDESGAVTVDWVALTAVVVGMGLAAGFTVGSSVPEVGDNLSSYMANRDVNPYD